MTILIFLLVLFVLILVHEWGHFIVAKKTGMRVDEFGIGFPPRLFSFQKGETLYSLNALPIGGFVRIFGQNYEDAETDESGRGFSSRPKWAQALVLIAGVTMNILFAWLLFIIVAMIGTPVSVNEVDATPDAQLYIGATVPESPASVLPNMAIIESVSVGDITLVDPTPSGVSQLVTETAPAPVTIEYLAEGELSEVTIEPVTGLFLDRPEAYGLGLSMTLVDVQSESFPDAVVTGLKTTISGLGAITVGIGTLISETFLGKADYSQIAGPVGIVDMVGDAASFGIAALLTFTAVISLNLAVINMLPFPALDGGRLLFVAIEAITRKPIPPQWAGTLNLVGIIILLALMVLVTINDVGRLL